MNANAFWIQLRLGQASMKFKFKLFLNDQNQIIL